MVEILYVMLKAMPLLQKNLRLSWLKTKTSKLRKIGVKASKYHTLNHMLVHQSSLSESLFNGSSGHSCTDNFSTNYSLQFGLHSCVRLIERMPKEEVLGFTL